jgi:hypothetical protein
MWDQFNLPRMKSYEGLLWTRQWTFWFHKRRGTSCLAKRLSYSVFLCYPTYKLLRLLIITFDNYQSFTRPVRRPTAVKVCQWFRFGILKGVWEPQRNPGSRPSRAQSTCSTCSWCGIHTPRISTQLTGAIHLSLGTEHSSFKHSAQLATLKQSERG